MYCNKFVCVDGYDGILDTKFNKYIYHWGGCLTDYQIVSPVTQDLSNFIEIATFGLVLPIVLYTFSGNRV